MQNPTMNELNDGFREAFSVQGERMLAMNRQWTDWQIAQVKAMETSVRTALHASFTAAEQMLTASHEMNRLVFGAFTPPKAQDKAQA